MINLSEVCSYLSNLLNSNANPVDFLYDVQAVGYHADTVYDKEKGKNLIRVFVSTFGGEFNPVPNLGQATYTIPVTFYFPVRFKESFFALDGYLHQELVGKSISSFNAVSNLSIATYGEIQDLDFKEFKAWADNLYKKPIEVMEKYMSMTVNLYLTTIADNYLMGNSAKAILSYGVTAVTISESQDSAFYGIDYPASSGEDKIYDGVTYYAIYSQRGIIYKSANSNTKVYKWNATTSQMEEITGLTFTAVAPITAKIPLVFNQGSLQSASQSNDNQFILDDESDGFPFSTAYGSSFSFYVATDLWVAFLVAEWAKARVNELANLSLTISIEEINFDFTRPVFVQSGNMVFAKGQPLMMTLAFAKRL